MTDSAGTIDTQQVVPPVSTSAPARRSDTVCVLCHSRKVKCDLQTRLRNSFMQCTNCENAGQQCHKRPSNRGKKRKLFDMPDLVVPNLPVESQQLQLSTILPLPERPPNVSALVTGPISTNELDNLLNTCIVDGSAGPQSLLAQAPPPVHTLNEGPGESYSGDVDTGWLNVYGIEHAQLAANDKHISSVASTYAKKPDDSQAISEDLAEGFVDTYFEYCYPWCPVLDRQTIMTEMQTSRLLSNAVALAASHIRPPLLPCDKPHLFYDRARTAFYNDEETDGMTALKALCLFYWWAPRSPSSVHRHSSWWWTSVIIRHAQQANVHREPSISHSSLGRINLSLRRRIWWTVFARERLSALCQSKPCIIDPEDCSISEVQPSDFPPDHASQKHGRIFLHWTRLCGIIGRIAKQLSRSSGASVLHLQLELVSWVQSLPPDLQLPIGNARTTSFDRDVFQLYLPYLTTIAVLNLKRSASDLPHALPPAILAASCTARVLRDILARGDARFLMPITCWYTGTAFTALMQTLRIPQLVNEARAGMQVLTNTCVELQKMWGSAEVIRAGFERVRRDYDKLPTQTHSSEVDSNNLFPDPENFDWTSLFPFVTRATGNIAACLLDDRAKGNITRGFPSPNNMEFFDNMQSQFSSLFEPLAFANYDFDIWTNEYMPSNSSSY